MFYIVTLVFAASFRASSAAVHTDSQDVYALRILYESLRSPSLRGWKFHGGGDPCGEVWHGVQCSGHNVIAVRLPGLKLRGSLGYALNKFNNLLTLDLSDNHIGETLPFQFPTTLVQLNLGNNVLIGSIPYSVKRLMSLTNLNLSRNFLSGDVPDIFEKLSNLQSLDISNNNFTGELPSSFTTLLSLSTLHMQQCELDGTLDVLKNLPLKDLNVENNNFSGVVPPKFYSLPIFRGRGNHFDSSGNTADLNYGPTNGALPLRSPGAHNSPSSNVEGSSRSLTGGKLAGIISGAILAVFLCTFLLFAVIFRTSSLELQDTVEKSTLQSQTKTVPSQGVTKDKREELPHASPVRPLAIERYKPSAEKSFNVKDSNVGICCPSYSYLELSAATGNFSKFNLIGEGLLGRVYKGEFADDKTMAIKKLESLSRTDEELLTIIGSISRLHHGNIVQLTGYCVENGQCVLVYSYYPKGTLHEHLHLKNRSEKRITWNHRTRIALGAARALEYMHEVFVPPTVHRNFKSANILLDEAFNPYVSDSGLAAFVQFGAERQIASQMLGAFGYSAPEYALAGIYTVKCDVYSFGVLMLELLTGREPLDSSRSRSREQSLVSWATPQLNDIDSLSKIVDPNLEGIYPAKALSKFAELISQCIQVEPDSRPAMSDVVQSLVALMKRSGISKRTVSRELNASREFKSSSLEEEALSLERSFERQNISDSVRFNM